MTVGNILGYDRFHPANKAMRLVGLLPTENGDPLLRPCQLI